MVRTFEEAAVLSTASLLLDPTMNLVCLLFGCMHGHSHLVHKDSLHSTQRPWTCTFTCLSTWSVVEWNLFDLCNEKLIWCPDQLDDHSIDFDGYRVHLENSELHRDE